MLNGGKWIVKMVKQAAPLLVAVGLSKPDGMIFQGFPRNQQQIAVRRFHAPADIDAGKNREWPRSTGVHGALYGKTPKNRAIFGCGGGPV